MEKLQQKVSLLKKELLSKDDDLIRAASYGKQLLEETSQLKNYIETLKQEKYSLGLNLDMKIKIAETQAQEIESLRDLYEPLKKKVVKLEAENTVLNKKLQETINENEELKSNSENVMQKDQHLEAQVSSLLKELDDCKLSLEMRHNETNSEEHMKLVSDYHECEKEKDSLVHLTNQLQHDLRNCKLREDQLGDIIEGLRQALQEREQEIQSYSTIVEKSKEENVELQAEIEMLKFEQVDVNKKGNSLFGEVEDQRKLVEKMYFQLKSKHDCLLQNYEIRQQEIKKLKQQMAILLGMFSSKVDSKYLQELENRLCAAQKEVKYLTLRLKEQSELPKEPSTDVVSSYVSTATEYNYFRTLLLQSQKREEELDKELQRVRLLYVSESDKLSQAQHTLYHSEKTRENLKGEVLKLKLKLEELNQPLPDAETRKAPYVESIPGFKRHGRKSSPRNKDYGSPSDKSTDENVENKPGTVLCVQDANVNKGTFSQTPEQAAEKGNKETISSLHKPKNVPSKHISAGVNVAVSAGNCAQQ